MVVAARRDNALVLTAVDAAAAVLGLVPGLPLATARAMHPALAVEEADAAADAALLARIADWGERYTPFVGLAEPDAIVLDIGGSAHLFGGEAGLMADLLGRARRAGLTAQGAIAGTRAAVLGLARHAPAAGGRDGLVVPPGGEEAAVAPLPVAALGLDEATVTALARLGLKRIGDLATRARGPLAGRFGTGLLDRLDRARGLAEEPITPRRSWPACLAERRFAEPIGHADDVQRSILALARDMAALLEQRGEGARRLELAFFRSDGALRRIVVESARPLRDPDTVLRLTRERLDALADPVDPGFGFDVMRLAALVTERLDAAQGGLDGQAREAEELADLGDRLAARLGARRVTTLAAQDTHWPERASLAVPHRRGTAARSEDWLAHATPQDPPCRPIRLFEPPERIEALAEIPDGPPLRFRWRRVLHTVKRAEGPERIAPEWWRAPADALSRDYFRVENEAGRRFWLFREGLWARETTTPRWFVHGLFA